MNMLIDLMPTSVKIDNVEYKINSDFRTSILFEMMMLDDSIGNSKKPMKALQLYYPVIPPDKNKAIDKLKWFYRCGKDIKNSNGTGGGKTEQIYSYEFDDDYIYSAFIDQYGVDLQDIEYLHWWKFKAMFKALKDDNMLVKIMGYRSIDLNSIKDKEQKAYYRRMKKLYAIPHSKEEEEKINAIEEALMRGEDVSKIL